ncbi:MAG: hypothetical protein ABSF38_03355 [Verrucomicrobiota bacterium]|jgi:hypothetical protein
MKMIKSLSALALLLGLATAANAAGNKTVYITGSTAFRSAIFNSLANDMSLTVCGPDNSSSNSFTFSGTIADPHGLGFANTGTAVDVFCTFAGSGTGVQACQQNYTLTFTNTAANGGGVAGGSIFTEPGADIGMSDVLQADCPPPANGLPTLNPVYAPGTSHGVAVQPFTWVADSQAIALGVNDMAVNTIANAFGNGGSYLSYWTGTAITEVYLTGRNNDSGTRITALADVGLNINNLITQNELDANGINWDNVGNGGYSSGGSVVSAISTSTALPAVGYASWSDSDSLKNGANVITFEGQTPGTVGGPWNFIGLENGSYTFWTYEQMYVGSLSGTAFADGAVAGDFPYDLMLAIQYEIPHASPQVADLISNMQVYRNGDGGPVIHN